MKGGDITMSDTGKLDVNSAEDTATDSSTGEQTDQDTGAEAKAEDTQTTDKNTQTETKEVPEQNRWAEKARKAEMRAKELEAKLAKVEQSTQPSDPQSQAVKEQLRQMGFITKEEQDAELRRRDEDARVQGELSNLEREFDGKDGRPKFDRQEVIDFALDHQIGDLEAAYWKLHRAELIDWHIKTASSKTRGIKTEASDGSGSSEAGVTDSDLKDAIAKGSQSALRTYLKRFAPRS
jgi:hypothetical protein